MKVIFSVSLPLLFSNTFMLISSPHFTLTAFVSVLCASPPPFHSTCTVLSPSLAISLLLPSPPAVRSFRSSRHPCHSAVQCHTACFSNRIVHYLTVSVQQGTPVVHFPLLSPSPHAGKGRDGGMMKEGGKKPWTRTAGSIERGIGSEGYKDSVDVWKSQWEWALFHLSIFQSVSSVDCPYQTDWRRLLTVWPSDCLNKAATTWLAFHHQPSLFAQIFVFYHPL